MKYRNLNLKSIYAVESSSSARGRTGPQRIGADKVRILEGTGSYVNRTYDEV